MIPVEDGSDFASIVVKLTDLTNAMQRIKGQIIAFQQLPDLNDFVAAYESFVKAATEMSSALDSEFMRRMEEFYKANALQ